MTKRPIDIALEMAAAKGWNQSEFARRLGREPAHITNWKKRGMPTDAHAEVAELLGCSIDALNGRPAAVHVLASTALIAAENSVAADYAGQVRLRLVPVVGNAKMGNDGFYDEISSIPGAGDGHIEIATRDPNAYGLRVRGMSMFPAIRDGWYVLIEPNGSPKEGEYVLVKLRDGRKMVKELLYRRSDSIELLSVNGDERLRVELTDVEGLQAVGAVVSPSKWKPD